MLLQYLCIAFICFTKTSFGVHFGLEIRPTNNTTNLSNVTEPVGLQNNNNTASSDLPPYKPALIFRTKNSSSSDVIPNSRKEDHKKEHKYKEDNIKKNSRKISVDKGIPSVITGKGKSNTDEVTDNNNNNSKIPVLLFPVQQSQTASPSAYEDITTTSPIDVPDCETSPSISNAHIQNKTSTPELPAVNKTTELSTKNYPTEKQKPKNNGTNYNRQYEDPGEADKVKVKEALSNSTQNKENTTKEIPHDPAAETRSEFDTTGSSTASNEKGKAKSHNTNDNHINAKSSEKFASTTTKGIKKDDSSFKFTRSGVTVFIISLIVIAAFVYSGFIVWKKLMLSQNRREILINEEEFCEDCTDAHQFEMDQQQNERLSSHRMCLSN
ncbi:uncharacterized protein LOC142321873 isoform X2 [Lycorma delicatula]|uniref:uncharacterized protein LOC142321873 isoform X2 n=1 Tax=Lycorma delicatula TaxID=130591 RepID=UPI003F50D6AA